MGQNVSLLESMVTDAMPMQALFVLKSRKKFCSSRYEMSISCTSEECDKVTIPYYLFSAP